MSTLNRSALKQTAAQRLAQATYDPQRLVLLHTGAVVALTLVLSAINYILQLQISDAGGLSGLGTRTVLSTIQMLLQLGQLLLLPFWQFGLIYAALRIYRQEEATPDTLLGGFRRFGPLLRLMMLEVALGMGIGFACSYLASFLFFMTPWGREMFSAVMAMGSEVTEMMIMETMMEYSVPLMVIFLLVFLAVCIPFFFRLRLAPYVLLDTPCRSALLAMQTSRRLMRGRCLELLKLDLSFWWFYLLLGVAVVVSFGDELLKLAGIALPVSEDVSYLVFYLLGILVQLVLFRFAYSHVQTTWAVAYEELRQAPEVETVQRAPVQTEMPKALPWEENE